MVYLVFAIVMGIICGLILRKESFITYFFVGFIVAPITALLCIVFLMGQVDKFFRKW